MKVFKRRRTWAFLFPPACPTSPLKWQPRAFDRDTHGLLYLTFTCQSEDHLLNLKLSTAQSGQSTGSGESSCLFICLYVWGGFASSRLSICIYRLDNTPLGILSYPVTSSHSQPANRLLWRSLSLWYAWAALTESSPWGLLLWHHRLPGRQPGGGIALFCSRSA